jgi:membrane protease YdiL (CAAX protease family)
MLKWQTVAVAYALLGSLAAGLAVALRNGSPFSHPAPWLNLDAPARVGTSLLLGVALAVVLVTSTRIAVDRWNWARRLHVDLRPVAKNLTLASIAIIAVLSSLGEELFFRGFLTPFLGGVVAQAILFGLAHQVSGPSRWVWVTWASLVGLCFGAIFVLTGSLVGPIVAHAIVNGYNLAFLRNHDPAPKGRRLGGLFAPSDV